MVTKYRRQRRGDNVDSRHFDSGFEFSGFNQDNSDGSYPEPPSIVKWIVSGLVVAVLTAAAIKELLLPFLDYLKGIA